MSEKLETIVYLILVIVLTLGLGIALSEGLKKTEENECYKWQKQAKEYTNFYLTKAENFQCVYLGIEVNAPVK